MKSFYKNAAVFVFSFSLCACATDTHVSPEEAQLSLPQFIQKELTGKNSPIALLDIVTNKVLAHKDHPVTLLDYNEAGVPLSDGSYVYFAPYTAENESYLTKPLNKLKAYCEAQGGFWKPIRYYRGTELIDGVSANPIQAYLTTRAMLSPFGGSNAADGRAAERAYDESEQYNDSHGLTEAKQAYLEVAKAGYFGYFSCVRGKKTAWEVSILPIEFKSADPSNQLKPESFYFGIRPEKVGS